MTPNYYPLCQSVRWLFVFWIKFWTCKVLDKKNLLQYTLGSWSRFQELTSLSVTFADTHLSAVQLTVVEIPLLPNILGTN